MALGVVLMTFLEPSLASGDEGRCRIWMNWPPKNTRCQIGALNLNVSYGGEEPKPRILDPRT